MNGSLGELRLLLEVSVFLLSTVFFFYAAIALIFRRLAKKYVTEEASKLKQIESEEYPEVSLIVPTYNEERIVAKKIQNVLELDYPNDRFEVIFVDGASKDSTPEILHQKIRESGRRMKLIRQKSRAGYNSAIIEGLRSASSKIIMITDAGAYHDVNALKNLVKHFHDSSVGVVMGGQRILNAEKGFVPKLEEAYWKFYEQSRMAESHIDSISVSKGECMVFRREICEKALSENKNFAERGSLDVNIVYEARKQFFKAKFEPSALFYEYAPETLKERFQQKTRRAINQINSMLLFKHMLLNKRFNAFGLVILPLQYFSLLVLPWMFVLGSVMVLPAILLSSNTILYVGTLVLILTSTLMINRYAFASFVLSQISLVTATLRILFSRTSNFIDIIPSTRQ